MAYPAFEFVHPFHQEVPHHSGLVDQGHLLILYKGFVDVPDFWFETFGEAGDGDGFVGEAGGELIAL
jgi:hypothetical protein